MIEGLLGFWKKVRSLLRVLRLLTLQKLTYIHPELCLNGVGGWRYYICVGYKTSRVVTSYSKCLLLRKMILDYLFILQ